MADQRIARGVLDTSVVIDLDAIDVSVLPAEVAVAALTMAELAAGPHAAPDSTERARRQDRLQRTEAAFSPLPFDADAARAYGRIHAAVTAAGRKARGARAVDPIKIGTHVGSVGTDQIVRASSALDESLSAAGSAWGERGWVGRHGWERRTPKSCSLTRTDELVGRVGADTPRRDRPRCPNQDGSRRGPPRYRFGARCQLLAIGVGLAFSGD